MSPQLCWGPGWGGYFTRRPLGPRPHPRAPTTSAHLPAACPPGWFGEALCPNAASAPPGAACTSRECPVPGFTGPSCEQVGARCGQAWGQFQATCGSWAGPQSSAPRGPGVRRCLLRARPGLTPAASPSLPTWHLWGSTVGSRSALPGREPGLPPCLGGLCVHPSYPAARSNVRCCLAGGRAAGVMEEKGGALPSARPWQLAPSPQGARKGSSGLAASCCVGVSTGLL